MLGGRIGYADYLRHPVQRNYRLSYPKSNDTPIPTTLELFNRKPKVQNRETYI
jgi:hypothetical protein